MECTTTSVPSPHGPGKPRGLAQLPPETLSMILEAAQDLDQADVVSVNGTLQLDSRMGVPLLHTCRALRDFGPDTVLYNMPLRLHYHGPPVCTPQGLVIDIEKCIGEDRGVPNHAAEIQISVESLDANCSYIHDVAYVAEEHLQLYVLTLGSAIHCSHPIVPESATVLPRRKIESVSIRVSYNKLCGRSTPFAKKVYDESFAMLKPLRHPRTTMQMNGFGTLDDSAPFDTTARIEAAAPLEWARGRIEDVGRRRKLLDGIVLQDAGVLLHYPGDGPVHHEELVADLLMVKAGIHQFKSDDPKSNDELRRLWKDLHNLLHECWHNLITLYDLHYPFQYSRSSSVVQDILGSCVVEDDRLCVCRIFDDGNVLQENARPALRARFAHLKTVTHALDIFHDDNPDDDLSLDAVASAIGVTADTVRGLCSRADEDMKADIDTLCKLPRREPLENEWGGAYADQVKKRLSPCTRRSLWIADQAGFVALGVPNETSVGGRVVKACSWRL